MPCGRRISSSLADFNLLKSWITICERDHNDYTEWKRYDNPKLWKANGYTLRVIDVEKKCVTEARWDARYVALSYVWGGVEQLRLLMSNLQGLSTEGGLMLDEYRRLIPESILDAMAMVARLGERFLWVDALCIIQDGHDIEEQIKNMDNIYNAAAWCLVVASAKDANTPLPRAGKAMHQSPEFQHMEHVRGKELAVILPPLSVVLKSSPWNTRAWTYQESVLSKRLLIVSYQQIYFTCRHGHTFCEDMALESSENPAIYGERDGHIYGVTGKTNFEVYAGAVEEYTSRNITYHEDALKAFAGVLSYLEMSFQGFEFLYGLPDTELDQALLWYPKSDQHRRQSRNGDNLFPSWSWAGWVG
ncbi:HET-domain-containing protein, partial [Zopfia rhizophila CBS 207.26]